MNGERAPMPGVGLLEPVDGVLGYVDYHKNLLLGILAFKRVVRLVPRILQVDERLGEAVDLHWKRPHHSLLPGVRTVAARPWASARASSVAAARRPHSATPANQCSIFGSDTRPSFASLFVTSVAATHRACAATSRASAPIGDRLAAPGECMIRL